MSKKKPVTTMTLKDFHGGFIPSELPLPSAPGVSARPPDRPTAAPSPSSAVPARPRTPAASSAAAAAAVAVPSFLTNPSRIGRHFDEDERTPFEAVTPRRPAPSPSSFASAQPVGAARSGPGNAWGARREVTPAAAPVVPAGGGGQIWSPTSVAQASAVEKVLSGRWHLSKPSYSPAPVSAPVLETHVLPPEMERPRPVGVRELNGVIERPGSVGVAGLDGIMERPRSVGVAGLDGIMERPRSVGVRELDDAMERPRSVGVRALDVAMEKGMAPVRPASHEGRVVEVRAEVVPERPKLKLLPRSKPIEPPAPSPTYAEDKQVNQVPVIASVTQVEFVHDAESRATVERPRLNLKSRSSAVSQSGESAAKERPSVFGGARPREQVLRERGVDALASDLEKTSPVGRSKNEFSKAEQKVEAMPANTSGEKAESYPSGHRGPRNADRKDYRRDTDRADAYRPTRREDSRKVARDMEKVAEQPRPEPETWRKPVEPPKPEITAPRFGKAATALELAQAFSKSMSDTVPKSRLTSVPSPRVPPSPGTRDQVGFSRRTDNGALHSGSPHPKINGY